ncbi:unnamed protein product [Durusdinium trenchii]|uniref:Uncharacterized protein n=1 Tax=Durusdinium trenchii TaxID=1381693 RepID=A0ABP0Q4K6_9DINO
MVLDRSMRVLSLALLCVSADGSTEAISDCEWPSCMPHCIPCENRKVGTCYMFGCSSSKGPTDCFLGKCLCKDGYCADGEMCKPQVCIKGAEPPPFHPNNFLILFSSMSSMEQFPKYEELQNEYMNHILQIIPVPLLLLLIGIVVSITTCACICCGGGSGYHYSMDFSDVQHDENIGLVSGKTGRPLISEEEFARRAWKKRPACCPMFCTSLLIFWMCFVGAIFRFRNYQYSEYVILESLERAEENAAEIANASLTINQTISDLHDNLVEIPLSCKTEDKVVKHILYTFTANALGAIDDYVDQVYSIVDIVVPIPEQIAEFRKFASGHRKLSVRLPLAPLLLMAVICGGIVLEATMTTCCRSSSLTRCVDTGLKLAAVIFALIILVVTFLIFVETILLITLSKFCEDVDNNVLSYINSTTWNVSNVIPEIAEYYIRGADKNPIVEYDTLALKYINQIQDYYMKASIALAGFGMVCPAFMTLDVNAIARKAKDILARARILLKGDNIYPYYIQVVRWGICNIVISGVGWMWVLQVVVGLVLFPLCAILTHKFLVGWAAWIKVKEARRQRMAASGIEGASSDSDDEEDDSDEQDSEMSDRSPGRSPITGRQLSGISGRNAWLPKRFF